MASSVFNGGHSANDDGPSRIDLHFCKPSISNNMVDSDDDDDNDNNTRMWANAQRDGRPAEYRWRPLFNAAKFG